MSDSERQIVEAAALECGLKLAQWRDDMSGMYYPFRSHLTDSHFWNPAQDDGDALRLIAAARISLEFGNGHVLAVAPGRRGVAEAWNDESEITAAVRLAVTRSVSSKAL